MAAVTNTFADNDTLTAAKLNQNFSDTVAGQSQLRTGNLASDAGVVARQIADRYCTYQEDFVLLPFSSGADFTAPVNYTLPAALTEIFAMRTRARPGQELYLCDVEVKAYKLAVSPTFNVKKNGATIGGAATTIAVAGNYYRLNQNTDPIANYLMGFANDDELTIEMGNSGTCCGVVVRLTWKRELSA